MYYFSAAAWPRAFAIRLITSAGVEFLRVSSHRRGCPTSAMPKACSGRMFQPDDATSALAPSSMCSRRRRAPSTLPSRGSKPRRGRAQPLLQEIFGSPKRMQNAPQPRRSSDFCSELQVRIHAKWRLPRPVCLPKRSHTPSLTGGQLALELLGFRADGGDLGRKPLRCLSFRGECRRQPCGCRFGSPLCPYTSPPSERSASARRVLSLVRPLRGPMLTSASAFAALCRSALSAACRASPLPRLA